MKKSILLIIFFILSFQAVANSQTKDFDSTVAEGIDLIYNIKFESADSLFKELIADYPNHPAGRFFLAMIDWWKILLDLENESNDDIFFAKLEDVIYQCDQILKKDSENVDALFFKGGAIGFRGRLRALRESWLKAADDGREALPIVNRAYNLDPSNKDVQLGFGIYNYYAEVVPDRFPFVKPVMIFFPKGDKQKGIEQLADAAANGKYTKTESKYFLMQLFYQFEQNFFKAEEYSQMLIDEYPDNPQFQRYFGRINVKQGDYFAAKNAFQKVFDRSKENFYGYNQNAKREAAYYIGYYYRIHNEVDSAITFFTECENISRQIDKKETSGFLINSLLYLGMLNDRKGNREKAVAYYKELLNLREYGGSHSLAKQYLKNPYGT